MRSRSFRYGEDKVAYAISRLRSHPADWARALLHSNNPVLNSWEEFHRQMDAMYANSRETEDFQRKLENLKQTGSARNYSVQFKTYTAILGIEDPDIKIMMYKRRLKPTIQRALALVVGIDSFDALVEKSIDIDEAIFEQEKAEKAERKATSATLATPPAHPPSAPSSVLAYSCPPPAFSRSSTANQGTRPPTFGPSLPTSGPRPPLSDDEKARRHAQGLCRYCGKPGHSRDNCYALARAKERIPSNSRYPTPVSTSSVNPTVSHVIMPSGNPHPQGQ